MASEERVQDLQSRIGALRIALEVCLARLAGLYGDDARKEIESLRDELINRFKNSGIPPDREMEHAEIVQPAIQVLQIMFDDALNRLKG
jgi:hypothetical protein